MSYALARKQSSAPATAKAASKSIRGDLRIGEPDDAFEREADRVADEVMSGGPLNQHWSLSQIGIGAPVQRECACGGSGEQCEECKKQAAQVVQRKPVGPAEAQFAPPLVHEVLRSPGEPLDSSTRSFMEPRFGWDFSHVRIHSDPVAQQAARDLSARAYTVGQNIVFAENQFSLATHDGRSLLAHELAHVVQQSGGFSPAVPTVQRAPADPPKFFDLSRGPLTRAERQELRQLRAKRGLPVQATKDRETIVGILILEDGERLEIDSSELGGESAGVSRAETRKGPGSGASRYNRTHVETWAGEAMRKRGLKRAVLLLEKEPCAVCGGYPKGHPEESTRTPAASAVLPEDGQLLAVDEEHVTYLRQAPTQPRTGGGTSKAKTPQAPPKKAPAAEVEQSKATPSKTPPESPKPSPVAAKAPQAPLSTEPAASQTEPHKAPAPKVEPSTIRAPKIPPGAGETPGSEPAPIKTMPAPAKTPEPAISRPGEPGAAPTKLPAEFYLAAYPPYKQGPVLGKFNAVTIQTAVALINGAITIGSLATQKDISAFGFVISHFDTEIDDASAELNARYPASIALREEYQVDLRARDYQAAIDQLEAPSKTLALAAAGLKLSQQGTDKEKQAEMEAVARAIASSVNFEQIWQNFSRAGSSYDLALSFLEGRIAEPQADQLYLIAQDLDRRSSALSSVADELQQLFFKAASSPPMHAAMAMSDLVEGAVIDLHRMSEAFGNIAQRLHGLADTTRSRAQDYRNSLDSLKLSKKGVQEQAQRFSRFFHKDLPWLPIE